MEDRRVQVIAAGLTDVGRTRHHNEDNILVRSDLGIFLVSDGMGGHNAGEVASALTVASLRNFFEATEPANFNEPDTDESMVGARRLVAAVHKANSDVHEISTTHPRHRGMGCTLVVLYLQPPYLHITHLGDSRCYRIRGNKIELLTRDHTLVNDILALKPDMSTEDLAHLPKNIVTRAIGIEPTVNFDVRTEDIELGDVFLLCSDGLTGMLSDAEILNIVETSEDPAEASSLLIQFANEAGGLDNISAVLVQIEPPADPNATTVRPAAPAPPPSASSSGPITQSDPHIPVATPSGALASGADGSAALEPAVSAPPAAASTPVEAPPVAPESADGAPSNEPATPRSPE